MTNQEVNEFMHRYLDDDLTEDEAEMLMEHLRQAPASAVMFERLKRLNADLEQLPKVTPPISIVDSILPRLEREGLWTESSVSSTKQPMGVPSEPSHRIAPPRGDRGLRLRSVYKWTGGVVAAGIALTVFISTLSPGGSLNDSADSDSSESANQITMPERAGSAQMKAADQATAEEQKMKIMATDENTPSSGAGESAEIEAKEEAVQENLNAYVIDQPKASEADTDEQLRKTGESEPLYSIDAAEPISVPSPDGASAAGIVAVDSGNQVIVSDNDGHAVYQSAVYTGDVLNLAWSEDSLKLTFDVTADGAVRQVTIDLANHTETASQ